MDQVMWWDDDVQIMVYSLASFYRKDSLAYSDVDLGAFGGRFSST